MPVLEFLDTTPAEFSTMDEVSTKNDQSPARLTPPPELTKNHSVNARQRLHLDTEVKESLKPKSLRNWLRHGHQPTSTSTSAPDRTRTMGIHRHRPMISDIISCPRSCEDILNEHAYLKYSIWSQVTNDTRLWDEYGVPSAQIESTARDRGHTSLIKRRKRILKKLGR